MNIFLVCTVFFILANFALKLSAEILNLNHHFLPPEYCQGNDLDTYKKATKYLKDNTLVSLIESGFETLVLLLFILIGGFNSLDLWIRNLGLSEIPTGLCFAGILFLALNIINLPFSIYRTFVIEEKYHFNTTSLTTFAMDKLKGFALGCIIGGIIFAALLYFFETIGSFAWVYAWAGVVAFQAILSYIGPTWLMPLFNQFEPLEEGSLKRSIEDYAKEQDFALKGIFRMDGSKRSNKANAFFTGFGKNKRVVLLDTLIKNHTEDEIIAILAHEIGHYKRKHLIKDFIMTICFTGLMLYLFSLMINNSKLFEAFQMKHLSIYASFFFFLLLYIPLETIASMIMNGVSRKHEFEADAYAVDTYKKPEALANALKKLSDDHLSNLTPHPFKVILSYSHPPIIQRLSVIHQRIISKDCSIKSI